MGLFRKKKPHSEFGHKKEGFRKSAIGVTHWASYRRIRPHRKKLHGVRRESASLRNKRKRAGELSYR